MRPASSTCSVLMKPWPSSPSSWSAGTGSPRKITSLVSLARMPSLFSFLPAVMPGVPCSTMKAEMPAMPLGAIGDRHHHHHAADRAVRDEGLGSVQAPSSRPARAAVVRMRGRVAAGVRLGQPPRAEHLAAHEPRQVLPLLRFVAEQGDVRRAQAVVRRDRQRDGRIDARQLLDADAVVDRRHRRRRRTRSANWIPSSPSAASLRQQLHRESAAPRPTP